MKYIKKFNESVNTNDLTIESLIKIIEKYSNGDKISNDSILHKDVDLLELDIAEIICDIESQFDIAISEYNSEEMFFDMSVDDFYQWVISNKN